MRRCTLQIATGHGEKLSGSDLRDEWRPIGRRRSFAFAMNLLERHLSADAAPQMNRSLSLPPSAILSRKSFDVASRLLLMRFPRWSPRRCVFRRTCFFFFFFSESLLDREIRREERKFMRIRGRGSFDRWKLLVCQTVRRT